MKPIKHPLIVFRSAVLSIGAIQAGPAAELPVTVAVPHAFSAGQPASAVQVNANFAALAAAINQLGQKVQQLENPSAPVIRANGTANTYKLVSTHTQLEHGFLRYPHPEVDDSEETDLETYVAEGELVLRLDGTWSLVLSETESTLETVYSSFEFYNFRINPTPSVSTLAGTWAQTGSTVSLTSGGKVIVKFEASLQGAILLGADNEVVSTSQAKRANAGIIVAILTGRS